jgi:ArsR family transcriptional regulator
MSVGELVDALGITQPTVSKHLKVLREAGVVRVREDGQHRFYRLDKTPLVSLGGWLAGFK